MDSRRIIELLCVAAIVGAALLAALAVTACRRVAPFSVAHVDRSVRAPSKLPIAVDPARVGSFPGHTKSGGGY